MISKQRIIMSTMQPCSSATRAAATQLVHIVNNENLQPTPARPPARTHARTAVMDTNYKKVVKLNYFFN